MIISFRQCILLGIFVCFCFVYILPYCKNSELVDLTTISYDEYNCKCPRQGRPISELDDNSLCSDWSTARGKNQSVIAYTLYGDHGNKIIWKHYYNQMEERIKEASRYYSGWVIRLYHNFSTDDEVARKFICSLYCNYPTFDPCQVNNIAIPHSWLNSSNPKSIFNMSSEQKRRINGYEILTTVVQYLMKNTVREDSLSPIAKKFESMKNGVTDFGHQLTGKLWRFLPLADSYVARFLVRDVDSYILPREVAAVNEWLQNYTTMIHAMRDHPSHNGLILAGMWGGIRLGNEEKLTNLMKKILMQPSENYWDFDQALLSNIVWPAVVDNILVHDSYHCNTYLSPQNLTLPFPTKRRGSMFISWGPTRSMTERNLIKPCPVECRPKNHKDWEYC